MRSASLPAALLICAAASLVLPAARPDEAPPAYADGVTDAIPQIQKLLDATAKSGGEVRLPPDQYLIKGTLTIPAGVALRGSWDAPHHGSLWDNGVHAAHLGKPATGRRAGGKPHRRPRRHRPQPGG
jgi:hypothetical protein